MDISVVVPVYNSAPILRKLVEELCGTLRPRALQFEIILVNDFSRDESWQVICALCDQFAEVRGLDLRRNTGQHNATMAGLNHAAGDVVVVMDDDLQHSPADVPRLVDSIRAGNDVCFVNFTNVEHPLWKRLGSSFNDWMAALLLDKPRHVYLSSFKAISRGLRDEIVKYTGPYAYIDGLILMATANIATIEARHNTRFEGRSNYSLGKSIVLWSKMATSFSVLPLRIAGFVGVLMASIGFLIGVMAIFMRLFGNTPIPMGWTSLLVAVVIIGGTQLVALWLIGEYLGRAYVRLNNVPQYSVRDRRNFDRGGSDR